MRPQKDSGEARTLGTLCKLNSFERWLTPNVSSVDELRGLSAQKDSNIRLVNNTGQVGGRGAAPRAIADGRLRETHTQNIASDGVDIEGELGQLPSSGDHPIVDREANAREGHGQNAGSTVQRWEALASDVVAVGRRDEVLMLSLVRAKNK